MRVRIILRLRKKYEKVPVANRTDHGGRRADIKKTKPLPVSLRKKLPGPAGKNRPAATEHNSSSALTFSAATARYPTKMPAHENLPPAPKWTEEKLKSEVRAVFAARAAQKAAAEAQRQRPTTADAKAAKEREALLVAYMTANKLDITHEGEVYGIFQKPVQKSLTKATLRAGLVQYFEEMDEGEEDPKLSADKVLAALDASAGTKNTYTLKPVKKAVAKKPAAANPGRAPAAKRKQEDLEEDDEIEEDDDDCVDEE